MDEASNPGTSQNCSWTWLFAIAIVSFVAFLPSLSSGFVFDDQPLIVDNDYVHSLRYISRAFQTSFWDTSLTEHSSRFRFTYYRPLVTISYLFNWLLSGGRPWAFHFTNCFLHAIASVLAFKTIERWSSNPIVSFICALIFALHPTRTENVVWVSGRTDVLMLIFALLALLAVARITKSKQWLAALGWSGLGVVSLVAGILCKESMAIVPLLVLVEATAHYHRKGFTFALRRFAYSGVFGLVLVGSYLGVRAFVLPIRSFLVDTSNLSLVSRSDYFLLTIGYYIERIVWPWEQTFFYRPVAVSEAGLVVSESSVAIGLAACLLFTAAVIWGYRKNRLVLAILIALVFSIGPHLNLRISGLMSTVSDRFLYLPLLLLLAAVACALPTQFRLVRPAKLVVAGGLLILLFCYVGSVNFRILDYRNNKSFWSSELAANPNNGLALREMGRLLAKEGDYSGGFDLIRRALEPDVTRFALQSPLEQRLGAYVELLTFQSYRLADGDLSSMAALRSEMLAISEARSEKPRQCGDYIIGGMRQADYSSIQPKTRASLKAEAAVLQTRMGLDNGVRAALFQASQTELEAMSKFNVVLSLARLGEFAKAIEMVTQIEKNVETPNDEALLPQAQELRARVIAAEGGYLAALAQTEPQKTVLLAQVQADLGAYGRALRLLRPLYLEQGGEAGLGPLYVQLLLAARLEEEAVIEATKLLGIEGAKQVISSIRLQLPKPVRRIPPVPAGVKWYDPSDLMKLP